MNGLSDRGSTPLSSIIKIAFQTGSYFFSAFSGSSHDLALETDCGTAAPRRQGGGKGYLWKYGNITADFKGYLAETDPSGRKNA